jgi:hypothetical protein
MNRHTHITKLKTCSVVCLLSLLLLGLAFAETGSEEFLHQVFGGAIKVQADMTGATVEYCPDNTCEVFRVQGELKKSPVSDFAYLYLYYVSDYATLSEVRKSHEAKHAAEQLLTQIRKSTCDEVSQIETIKCVLRQLAKRHSISLVFARYDEEVRIEVPKVLERELSRLKQLPK